MVIVRLGLDQGEAQITGQTYGRFLALLGEALERGKEQMRTFFKKGLDKERRARSNGSENYSQDHCHA